MINAFVGEYVWLSNAYWLDKPVEYEGIAYPTIEHAFHASKIADVSLRQSFASLSSPYVVRKAIRGLPIIEGWNERQFDIMKQLLKAKFDDDIVLKVNLLETRHEELCFGNTLNDTMWGSVWSNAKNAWLGENRLGKLLMELRSEYQAECCKD